MEWIEGKMDSAQRILRPPSIEDVDLKIGFVGAGQMAQALCRGFLQSGLVKVSNMMCSDVSQNMLDRVTKLLGIRTTMDNKEVFKSSDVVVLAVKPHMVLGVLEESFKLIHQNHLIVSIAAGVTIGQMEAVLPSGTRLVRVMPNTPAMVQSSASVFSPGSNVCSEDDVLVQRLFSAIGYCASLPEKHLDCVTALSGSGPAYIFMAIEAMADGGVKMGLPRDIALKLAAQTAMGAGKMVLEMGKHPGELKDSVCSPGGTTIAGVHCLEKCGFRSALIGAVEAGTLRSLEMRNIGDKDK